MNLFGNAATGEAHFSARGQRVHVRDARAIPAHHQLVAVMLDFVDPPSEGEGAASRRFRRQAWFDEAGGTPSLDHGRRWARVNTACACTWKPQKTCRGLLCHTSSCKHISPGDPALSMCTPGFPPTEARDSVARDPWR